MQDRRRTRATEVVALQVAPFPQLFARARVQTSHARLAKRHVNPALFDDWGGGCVAVVPFPEIRLIGLEDQQVVDHFARVSVEAHRVESTAAVVGRGHPNLVSPNHRGGPPFVMDCGLPSDVLLLGPLQRKLRRGADTIATRPSEFGPVFVGGQERARGQETEEKRFHAEGDFAVEPIKRNAASSPARRAMVAQAKYGAGSQRS